MQPPSRTTRSKASPGVVDLPEPRRPSAVVSKEKAKKQEATKLKAAEARRRAAQVKAVEAEVRKAQKEGLTESRVLGKGDKGKKVKKAFSRPAGDVSGPSETSTSVSLPLISSDLSTFTDLPVAIRPWRSNKRGKPIPQSYLSLSRPPLQSPLSTFVNFVSLHSVR
jgi:hypothetical protein